MCCAFTSYPIFRHSPPLASIHDLPGELEMKEDMEIPVLDLAMYLLCIFLPLLLNFSSQYEASRPPATFLVILIIEFGKFCLKPIRHVII